MLYEVITGDAGAVEVHQRGARVAVKALPGVFLEVNPLEAHALRPGRTRVARYFQIDEAPCAKGQFGLGDLIALGKVGVKKVLSVKPGEGGDSAVQGETGDGAPFDEFAGRYRHSARQAEADRAYAGIRRSSSYNFV